MNPLKIIQKHCARSGKTLRILLDHGEQVARKALEAAGRVAHLAPDCAFIREAALLHDIGIIFTDTPQLGCSGRHPYIRHGILGRTLLEKEGLQRHALVCERHVGVGITCADIRSQRLPMPMRDMQPITIEEQIICYADKFFSKNGGGREKSSAEIVAALGTYGADKVERFRNWIDLFGG